MESQRVGHDWVTEHTETETKKYNTLQKEVVLTENNKMKVWQALLSNFSNFNLHDAMY